MRLTRIFAMFFMVLDLRLVKIGCRETINFFVYTHYRITDSTLELAYTVKLHESCRREAANLTEVVEILVVTFRSTLMCAQLTIRGER